MRLFLTAEVDVEAVASNLQKTVAQLTASKVFGAVVIAAVSLLVIKVLSGVLERALRRSKMDDTLKKLLGSLLRWALYFVTVIVVLDCLGIKVTSLVAVLSVMGLAFSLALQNFLSNMAGGMQLLASHPFKLGDFVDVGICSGTVTDMGMFYTKLTTPDNKLVQIPNSAIVSANITNFSAEPTRRVELKVSASYNTPVDKVVGLLKEMAADHSMVLEDPEPAIHVEEYGDSAIVYIVRVWCANEDYWTVYFDLMDGLKPAFDRAGVEMTYPHVNVHMMKE